MRIIRVVPIITVHDLDSAIRLYRDALGMVEDMNLGWIATMTDSQDMRRQVGLVTNDLTAPCNPQISIQVSDVNSVYSEITELGLEIVHPLTDEPWGARRFFFRDSSGNVINVLSSL